MKKLILLLFIGGLLSVGGTIAENLHVDVYTVDVNHSSAEWYAAKMTGKHNGTVNILGGEIKNNHGQLTGSIEIDMNTIKNSDIKD